MNLQFWKAAGIRALRTMMQTIVGVAGAGTLMSDVDWKRTASAAVLAGIMSLATSIATGLPEVDASAK